MNEIDTYFYVSQHAFTLHLRLISTSMVNLNHFYINYIHRIILQFISKVVCSRYYFFRILRTLADLADTTAKLGSCRRHKSTFFLSCGCHKSTFFKILRILWTRPQDGKKISFLKIFWMQSH